MTVTYFIIEFEVGIWICGAVELNEKKYYIFVGNNNVLKICS